MHKARSIKKSSTLQVPVNLMAVIHLEPDVGGYSAEIPSLPGCYTQGETLAEVKLNLKEAAEAWLEAAHDHATKTRKKETA